MDKPMDVLDQFPVRKSKKQKTAFLDAVLAYGSELGYEARIEKGSFGVRNLVLGDPEKADYLITAHYDTCAGLPFPNLITPCSFVLFMAWQILLVVLLGLPAGVIGGVVGGLTDNPMLAFDVAYLLLVVELIWMLYGPANKHNANDNTSGVVAVLETAAAFPEELRSQVCFVLFDLEEGGLLGSASYRKAHKKSSDRQIIFNLDCVGEGNEILLFPTGKLKKKTTRMDILQNCSMKQDEKSVTIRRKGFSVYPSDQANFPLGLGIASFCRSKWAGLYLGKIHTKRDTNLDEKNVALLRDFLIRAVQNRA